MAKATPSASDSNVVPLVLSWTLVGIPLVWGVSLTLINASKLFK